MSHESHLSPNIAADSPEGLNRPGHSVPSFSASERSPQLASKFKLEQELLEKILDNVADRVYVKDLAGRITYANKAFVERFCGNVVAILGKHGDEFLPHGMREPCRQADEKLLQNGEPICLETSYYDVEGQQHWSESYKSPLFDDDGTIIGLVGVGRDVTNRKQTEEKFKQQESLLFHASRLSSLGQLIAEVVHEINQPCFAILNFAKAIENTLNSQDQPDIEALRKWNTQIVSEATRMGEITKRMRSYVRRDVTRREQADLNEIALESIEFVSYEARRNGVTIECDLAEEAPRLSVDRVQMQQVLVNLLRNAIEALSEHGTGTNEIIVATKTSPNGAEISVTDNGPGIPDIQQHRIFTPFHTTKHAGMGLGLAISKTIVESHKGTLSFESEEDVGTTFRCVFVSNVEAEGE